MADYLDALDALGYLALVVSIGLVGYAIVYWTVVGIRFVLRKRRK